MAKFTETLIQFIEWGGSLPASFSQIEDFDTLFLQRFGGREIGYETEELFKNALDYKAKIVMPIYAKRLAIVNKALADLESISKTRSEQHNYGATEQTTDTDGSTTELPYDEETATPAGTTKGHGEAITKAREDTATYTDYVTIDENLRLLDEMSQRKTAVLEACLEEFENCFMGVF